MNISKKTKKASAFVAILSIISLVLFGVLATVLEEPVEAEPQLPEEHLFVEEIYLLKTAETNETLSITCTPYLTNIWEKESGEIKIIAYVIKQSNKVADCKSTVEIGKISADSTAEIEIPLELKDDSYKVDILIFEDEKLVVKGSFSIKTAKKMKVVQLYDEAGTLAGSIESVEWGLDCSISPKSFQQVSHVVIIPVDHRD